MWQYGVMSGVTPSGGNCLVVQHTLSAKIDLQFCSVSGAMPVAAPNPVALVVGQAATYMLTRCQAQNLLPVACWVGIVCSQAGHQDAKCASGSPCGARGTAVGTICLMPPLQAV